MGAVHSLALKDFVKTEGEKDDLRLPCHLHRLGEHFLIHPTGGTVKAASVGNRHALGEQSLVEIVKPRGVNLGGAGALITGRFRKVADKGDFFIFCAQNRL